MLESLFPEVFSTIDEIKQDIQEIFGKVKDIVGVFSEELAAKIQATEEKLLRTISKYTTDLRDELIGKLHDITDPIIRKIDSITAVIEGYIRPIEEAFNRVKTIIETSFEKPQLLRRETMEISGLLYGEDLYDAMFRAGTTKIEREDEESLNQIVQEPLIEDMKWLIKEPEKGYWQDVEKEIVRQQEEVKEGVRENLKEYGWFWYEE